MQRSDNENITEIFSRTLSNALATLVLYNTSLKNSITYQTLGKSLGQLGVMMDILVYDNSLNSQKMPASDQWRIHYVHDPANGGVSKAYNASLPVARQLGKDWLFLLDQDTSYPLSTITSYCHLVAQNPDQQIFVPMLLDTYGLVSPLKFKLGGGQRIKNLKPGIYSTHDYKFHNCGLLVSTNAFEKAGGYDEQLPLDFSDFSFVERLKTKQSTFVITGIAGGHQLAATDSAPVEERLTRFKSYIKACRYYKLKYHPADWAISVRLFFRSLKLALAYRTFRFVSLYFEKAA